MAIKAGMYKGRVIAGSEQWTTSKNGNLQLVLTLDVWDPHADAHDPFTVSTFLTFTENSQEYEFNRLRECGWMGGDFPTKHLTGIDRNEVDVQVKYETYQGKEQMKVQIFTGGGSVKVPDDRKLSDADLRKFQAVFRGMAPRAAKDEGPNF